MRFISKRLGLIIWAVVAIAIMVVPLWRWRASQQWKSPILRFTQLYSRENNSFGLSSKLEDEAARHFPDEPIAQIAALHGVNLSNITLVNSENPYDDPRVRRAQSDYFARYDALEKKFPNANIVRAQHLIDVTRGWLDIDQGPQPKLASEARRIEQKRWLSETQLEDAARTAREGARIEPQNSFFPWMEAIIEFSLRHDDAAIAALQRAGKCEYFDDYMIRNVDARLKLLHRLRAVGWEDEFAEWSGAILPEYAWMRTAARATMGRARLARKRGDEARALELAGIVQRAGATVEQTNGMMITKLVGQAICLEAWKTVIENELDLPVLPPDVGETMEQRTRQIEEHNNKIARRFADYARNYKRPDLAREALNIVAKFDAKRLSDVYKKPGVEDINADVEQLSRAYWLGGIALIFGVSASVLWLLAWPLSRREEDARVRRQSLWSSMFIAGITVSLVVATLKFVPHEFFGLWNETKFFDTLWLVNPDNLKLLALLWVSPILIALLLHAGKILVATKFWVIQHNGKANWLGIACALVATGFVLGSCGVMLSLGNPMNWISDLVFPVAGISSLGCALIGSAMIIVKSRGLKRVLACCIVGTFWAGLFSIAFNDPIGDHLFYSWIAASIALVLFLCAFVVTLRIGKFSLPTQLKEFAFQLAARTRIAAGVLALLCAVAYFGITLWTIPVEAQARSMMQRQLQVGEVAWLREQMKTK